MLIAGRFSSSLLLAISIDNLCDDKTFFGGSMSQIEKLLEQIKENEEKLREAEGDTVVLIVEQARLMRSLRKKARRNWQKELKKINFSPRVASRYLTIAENWS